MGEDRDPFSLVMVKLRRLFHPRYVTAAPTSRFSVEVRPKVAGTLITDTSNCRISVHVRCVRGSCILAAHYFFPCAVESTKMAVLQMTMMTKTTRRTTTMSSTLPGLALHLGVGRAIEIVM